MNKLLKIGFGGGCHWCTEAVFLSLIGIRKVEQGFIAPKGAEHEFSEAVMVHFDNNQIGIRDLVEIHLYTHKSTSQHAMRNTYRSAIYFYESHEKPLIERYMKEIQKDFIEPIITQILPFANFRPSEEKFQNYYYKDIKKPFCETHISPKIALLMNKFLKHVSNTKSREDH